MAIHLSRPLIIVACVVWGILLAVAYVLAYIAGEADKRRGGIGHGHFS